MAEDTLRVRAWTGDGYGDLVTYPKYARYRMEPNFPGATGDKQHTLVVYRPDEDAKNGEEELGRHDMGESLIAFPGQTDPTPTTDQPTADGPVTEKAGKDSGAKFSAKTGDKK